MNFSTFIGLSAAVGVLYFAVAHSGMDPMFFVNMHGIVIVLGGTFAAAVISFPLSKMAALIKVFFFKILASHKENYKEIIQQILDMNKKITVGTISPAELTAGVKHPFLKEAVELVTQGVLTEKQIRDVLEQRVKSTEERYAKEANMFKQIGKFPPAFGLLATTFGMIKVLKVIGQPGSEKLIGPEMSIGLVGTLLGIATANLVFLPLAENLQERSSEEMALRRMIVEGALLLKSQVNPMTLRESLNSFLPPGDRLKRSA